MYDLRQIADKEIVMNHPIDKLHTGEPRYSASQMRDMFVAGYGQCPVMRDINAYVDKPWEPITGKTSTVDALSAAWSGDYRDKEPKETGPSPDYHALYVEARNDLASSQDECDRLNRIIDGLIR